MKKLFSYLLFIGGLIAFVRHQYKFALQRFRQAEDNGLSTFRLKYYTCICYRQLAELEKAKSLAVELTNDYPHKADSWTLFGLVTRTMGDGELSLYSFERALEINPNMKEAKRGKMLNLLTLKRYEEADSFAREEGLNLDDYSELLPTSINLIYIEAEEAFLKGDMEVFLKKIEQVLREDPNHASTLSRLGVYYGMRGEHEKAIELFKRSLQSKPKDLLTRSNLAYAYFQIGDLHNAGTQARRVVKKKPGFATPYYVLAEVYKKGWGIGGRLEVQGLLREAKMRGEPEYIYEL